MTVCEKNPLIKYVTIDYEHTTSSINSVHYIPHRVDQSYTTVLDAVEHAYYFLVVVGHSSNADASHWVAHAAIPQWHYKYASMPVCLHTTTTTLYTTSKR